MTIPQDKLDAAMKRLADGEPYRSVSRATGLTLNTLHRRFKASGLSRVKRVRQFRPEAVKGATLVVQYGMTYEAAAEATGASKTNIWHAVKAGHGAIEGEGA